VALNTTALLTVGDEVTPAIVGVADGVPKVGYAGTGVRTVDGVTLGCVMTDGTALGVQLGTTLGGALGRSVGLSLGTSEDSTVGG
jgi:hypothetical protein